LAKRQNLADLRVYIEHGSMLYRTVGVSATRTANTHRDGFELYVYKFHGHMDGRDSLHSSGQVIRRTPFVRTEDREWRRKISETQGVRRLTGLGYGHAHRDGIPTFQPSGPSARDDDNRRQLTIGLPQTPHGYEIFAIPQPAERVLTLLAETPPFPGSRVVGLVAADWVSPAIAVVVWEATDSAPYTVTEYAHEPSRSVRISLNPAVYRGTWVRPNAPATDDLNHGLHRGPWASGKPIDPTAYFWQS